MTKQHRSSPLWRRLLLTAAVSATTLLSTEAQISDFAHGTFLELDTCVKDTSNCVSFSSLFGAGPQFDTVVTIPCDKCVTMSEFINDEQLIFTKGIDIEGTLYFPEGTKVLLFTTMMTVQGKLSIHSNAVIDGTEDVRIVMEGTEDYQFLPHDKNKGACENPYEQTDKCEVGKKTIVVAGGTLDIDAIPDTCDTWTRLMHNVRADYPVPVNYTKNPTIPTGCNQLLLNDDFEDGTADPWDKSVGAQVSVVDDAVTNSKALKVTRRGAKWQGAFIELGSAGLKDCLEADIDYLFKFKAKIVNPSGNTTDCTALGENCLKIQMNNVDFNNTPSWRTLFEMPNGARPVGGDGEWFDIHGTMQFQAADLASDAIYNMFYVSGPEAGVDIYLDDFVLEVPAIPYPDPTTWCTELAVNGDAELSPIYPHPMKPFVNPGGYVTIGTEQADGNQFFKITGRERQWASINVQLLPECLVRYTKYTVSAKLWVQSVNDTVTAFGIQASNNGTVDTQTLAECDASNVNSGWVTCSKAFMFGDEHESADTVNFFVRTDGDLTSDLWIDDVSISLLQTPVDKIVLPSDSVGCWGVGAELLITSHTIDLHDAAVESITDVQDDGENTTITLSRAIEWHTTIQESPQTGVEVALLSRNVLFSALTDDIASEFHGGNMMILHTPDVVQKFKGVELRKFGQQGNIGKYPIHFHLSQNVEGSEISKNTIRNSFQRCIVIHATHNVTIYQNIAYDTFGHCFMVEDGIEQDNLFEENLGSHTKITPPGGILSIDESDMFASTFWITNPNNMFLNNVAAGSEDTGFWYEFLELVRGPSVQFDPFYEIDPSSHDYGYNIGTVCHSNHGDGFKNYPNGYFPDVEAVFKDMRSYLNKGDGILLHNSAGLAVEGGYLADNRQCIDVDKQADAVRVSNVHMVGYSPLYRALVEGSKKPTHCPAHRPLVGLQLHSFLRYRDSDGYTVENCKFEHFGYSITGCHGSAAMNMDPQTRDDPPHYDAFATFRNLTFEDSAPLAERFDACALQANGVQDLAIRDFDGSLNPAGTGVPGYIVSNTTMMTAFNGGCSDITDACLSYCENVCYRTLNFAIPMAEGFKDLTLQVTDEQGNVAEFFGYFEYMTHMTAGGGKKKSSYDNYVYQRRRYYSPILPYGNFTIKFMMNGTHYFPDLVEYTWDVVPECSPHVDSSNINIVHPQPTGTDCIDLVRNPGGEDGTFDFWQHTGSDIKIVTPGFMSPRALSTVWRKGPWQGIGQFLDTRCFEVGNQFALTAKFRLWDETFGEFANCDANIQEYISEKACPRLSFRLRTITGDQIGAEVVTSYGYPFAEAVAPTFVDAWNTMYGVLTVTQTMADANSIFVFVERGRPGLNIQLDNLEVVPHIQTCDDVAYNRDLESGDSRWWTTMGQASTTIVSPGYNNSGYAIQTTARKSYWSSMAQKLPKTCFTLGGVYDISAKFKLHNIDGSPYDCEPHRYWGIVGALDKVCPSIGFRTDVGNITTYRDVGKTIIPWNSGDWNEVSGIFTADEYFTKADNIMVHFTKFVKEAMITVDDLSIKPVYGIGCDENIIYNGDAETGDTRNWLPYYDGVLNVVQPGFNNSAYAVSYTGLNDASADKRWHEGLGPEYLDKVCIVKDILYEVKAQVKLRLNGQDFTCDPSKGKDFLDDGTISRCPALSVAYQNKGQAPQRRIVAALSTFNVGGWNELQGWVNFLDSEVDSWRTSLVIHHVQPGVEIIVDNFEMRKIWDPNAVATARRRMMELQQNSV